jgi:uncharacterized protein (TIGR02996 family)
MWIAITGPDFTRTVELKLGDLTIGRIADNDVVLPHHNISRRHARFVAREGADQLIIVDLKSTNGTFVNGERIVMPWRVGPSDRIQIGDFTLAMLEAHANADSARVQLSAPFRPRDPAEEHLLAQIDAGDPGSREVYADWLEEHDFGGDAAFVRAQDELADRDVARKLAATVSYRWRLRVARAPIEACSPRFDFACPKQWVALAKTDRDDVRFCDACTKPVYFCSSVDEARDHAANGECVALDLRPVRRANDLAAPYGPVCTGCKLVIGDPDADACPRCGRRTPSRQMPMGMIAPR